MKLMWALPDGIMGVRYNPPGPLGELTMNDGTLPSDQLQARRASKRGERSRTVDVAKAASRRSTKHAATRPRTKRGEAMQPEGS